MTFSAQSLRPVAALCAAALGVEICLYQRHFTLTLADPHSFAGMANHRCGLCLLTATAWVVLELAWACLRPQQVTRRQQRLSVR